MINSKYKWQVVAYQLYSYNICILIYLCLLTLRTHSSRALMCHMKSGTLADHKSNFRQTPFLILLRNQQQNETPLPQHSVAA